jgi:hypothetical protein
MTLRALLVMIALLAAGPMGAQAPQLPPVEEFVRMRNFHGMDFAVASRYGPEAVEPLRAILADEREVEFWGNAVWLLGIIATDEAVKTLIEFHEDRVEGVVGPQVQQALLLVPQALGFAAHDPESPAFDYLREGVDPQAIARRDLKWTGEGWEPGSRELLLAKLHANGLGIAGNEAARQILVGLRERLPSERPELWRFMASNVNEAIVTNRRIEELGYLKVFSDPSPTAPPPEPRLDPTSPEAPGSPLDR